MRELKITPDFSNAKEGDKCFSVTHGMCKIRKVLDGWIKYITPIHTTDSCYMTGNGLSRGEDGKEYWNDPHPRLFNSFDQFKAYWAEHELKMKAQEEV